MQYHAPVSRGCRRVCRAPRSCYLASSAAWPELPSHLCPKNQRQEKRTKKQQNQQRRSENIHARHTRSLSKHTAGAVVTRAAPQKTLQVTTYPYPHHPCLHPHFVARVRCETARMGEISNSKWFVAAVMVAVVAVELVLLLL